MRILLIATFFLFSTLAFGQEIGSVQNGKHSIKLVKSATYYSLLYSDIKSETNNSFLFSKVESVRNIIFDGFKSAEDHLVIVKTANDTIVKFEFKTIRGVPMVKIKQNNLNTESFGSSTFFTMDEMVTLFESGAI